MYVGAISFLFHFHSSFFYSFSRHLDARITDDNLILSLNEKPYLNRFTHCDKSS